MQPDQIEGNLKINGDEKIAIVAARFNDFIVNSLLQASVDTLVRHGLAQSNIDIIRAPGAFELPLITKLAAKSNRYDGIIALGAVIRGATAHFEYVAGECASGLSRVATEFEVPVMFGVLTTDTIEQAMERAGTKSGNKGADCAIALIEMMNLCRQLKK